MVTMKSVIVASLAPPSVSYRARKQREDEYGDDVDDHHHDGDNYHLSILCITIMMMRAIMAAKGMMVIRR